MVARLLRSFDARRLPLMTRPSYRHELRSAATFPVSLALLEGAVISVLAKTIFGVSDFAFATIVAAPMFANLTSTFWARLARKRLRVPFTCGLMAAVLAINAIIALLPVNAAGGVALVGLVVLGRCLIAGIINVRSTIWRHNYPRHARGQITGRLILIMALMFTAAPLVGYLITDLDPALLDDDPATRPTLFRWVYFAAAAIGVFGVFEMSRLRLRRQRELLADEHAAQGRRALAARQAPEAATAGNPTFISVLRDDRHFRRYMTWQFLAGSANMMGNAAAVRYIVELFQGHRFESGLSVLYSASIPTLCFALSLPFWARYIDKVHITTFRTRHGLTWVFGQSTMFLAAVTGLWVLLIPPRIIHGLMMGGGSLAWQLGHNDFADRRLVTLYMGIHQTLTGLRGAFAPFLGVFLLMGWEAWTLPGVGVSIPGFAGIGPYVFLITTAVATVGWGGFVSMHLERKREAGATDT